MSNKVRAFIKLYSAELSRFEAEAHVENVDTFLDYEGIQWSRNLKRHLTNQDKLTFDKAAIVTTIYRPFSQRELYNADITVDEPAKTGRWSQVEGNRFICVPTIGGDLPPGKSASLIWSSLVD